MKNNNTMRWVAVAAIVAIAFAGAYAYGQSRNGGNNVSAAQLAQSGAYVDPAAVAAAQAVASSKAAAQRNASSNGAANASGSCCGGSGATGAGGSCCGGTGSAPAGGVTGGQNAGSAAVTGGVQKIAVDGSSGTYTPNVVQLKAGVPAEITFAQSSGCTAIVQSEVLNFQVDTSTGPQTVKLPALQAGTYAFHCGMNMVFGKIVVK